MKNSGMKVYFLITYEWLTIIRTEKSTIGTEKSIN